MHKMTDSIFLRLSIRGCFQFPFSSITSLKPPVSSFASISSNANTLTGLTADYRQSRRYFKTRLTVFFWLALSGPLLTAHPELDVQINAITVQLEKRPGNAELYLTRADVRRQHGEFELALADISTAARLKPGWSKVPLVRAKTLFDAGRFQEAQAAVEKFLKEEPAHAIALQLHGQCHLKLGQYQKAIADYGAALKAFAQPNPELYVQRAQLQATLGRFAEAIQGLDEGIQRFGQAPTLQLAAIEFERQRGDFDAALQRTGQLLATVRQPDTLILQAQLLEQAGRLKEAQKVFQDILATGERSSGIRLSEMLLATLERAREGLARVEAKLSRELTVRSAKQEHH